jgi:hypothetical protein
VILLHGPYGVWDEVLGAVVFVLVLAATGYIMALEIRARRRRLAAGRPGGPEPRGGRPRRARFPLAKPGGRG